MPCCRKAAPAQRHRKVPFVFVATCDTSVIRNQHPSFKGKRSVTAQSLYQQKRMTAADAVRQVRNGDTIVVPTGVGEPPTLLTALSEQRRDFSDVKVSQILAMRKYDYLDPQTVDHVRHVAFFFGGATRAGGRRGGLISSRTTFPRYPSRLNAAKSRPKSFSPWRHPWTNMATLR